MPVVGGVLLLVVVLLVAVALVGGIAWSGIAYLIRRSRMRSAPARSTGEIAASVAAGPWRLRAKVVGAVQAQAPVSGRACAAWVLEVEERREPEWIPLRTVASEAPFELDDGSGAVEVRPAGASWHLETRARDTRGDAAGENVRRLLWDEAEGDAPPRREWRVLERVVSIGDALELVGWSAEGAVAGQGGTPLVIADRNLDAAIGRLAGRAVLAIVLGGVLLAWIAASAVWTMMKLGRGGA